MARVNVEDKALQDPRFRILGNGLMPLTRAAATDVEQAFGLFLAIKVWNYAVERGTDVIPGAMIDGLYPGLCDAMIEAELLDVVNEREVRVRGYQDSGGGWLAQKRAAAPRGGQARAASATRGPSGRFARSPAGAPADGPCTVEKHASNQGTSTVSTSRSQPETSRPSQPETSPPAPAPALRSLGSSQESSEETRDGVVVGVVVPRADRAVTYTPGFERAWLAYPHHPSRRNKQKAFDVWLRKRQPLEPLTENVLAWIAYASATPDFTKNDGEFVAAMEVWLKKPDFREPPPLSIARASSGLSERDQKNVAAAQRWLELSEGKE